MSDDMSLTAQDEVFDFSGDGAEAKDVVVTAVGFDIVDKDGDGQKVRHVIEFSGADLPYNLKVSEWARYAPNEVAERIGRGNLRKVAKALTGEPKYAAATIVGTTAIARMAEDKDGFLKLTRFRPNHSDVQLG